MTKTLYFDCATTRFHADRKTGEEPALIRLAWLGENGAVCRILLAPPGATIDPYTVKYHQLTAADIHDPRATEPMTALTEFMCDAAQADRLVCFHADYHFRFLERASTLAAIEPLPQTVQRICLMKLAEPICAIPHMEPGGGFKSPSFAEAYEFLIGTKPELPIEPVALGLFIVEALRDMDRVLNGETVS